MVQQQRSRANSGEIAPFTCSCISMLNWYALFTTLPLLAFLSAPAQANHTEKRLVSFCRDFPHICTHHSVDLELINSFLIGFEFEASHSLGEKDIPFPFETLNETEIEQILKNAFRISKAVNDPDMNIERVAQWLAGATIAALEANASSSQWMNAIARLTEQDWNTLADYILDEGQDRSWKKVSSFRKFTEVLVFQPKSLSIQIKVFQSLKEKTRWSDFFKWLSSDELVSLAKKTSTFDLERATEAWGHQYVEFLTDLNSPKKQWSISELYKKHYFPRIAGDHWGILYPGQEKDLGKIARVSFSPHAARTEIIEGRITKIEFMSVEITTRKGEIFHFNKNEGKFNHFFVSDPDLGESFSEYFKKFSAFYKAGGNSAATCSFLLL